ncbi:MAG: hypothetical protein LBE10_02360 [Treponema sp.]|jgi:hypothetical protein|nr:hypothetical protein [Treponema sp.]
MVRPVLGREQPAVCRHAVYRHPCRGEKQRRYEAEQAVRFPGRNTVFAGMIWQGIPCFPKDMVMFQAPEKPVPAAIVTPGRDFLFVSSASFCF